MSDKTTKPIVYIASPYTKGDACINTHFQCKIFDQLMNDGVVFPFIPLLTHFQHTVFPRPYKDWIEYDLALLERFDACIRLDAVNEGLEYNASESSGADGEVARFEEIGKPVFYSIEDCYKWVNEQAVKKDREERRGISTFKCCLSEREDGIWRPVWEDEEDHFSHKNAAQAYVERMAEDVENWENIYVRVWNTDKETVKEAQVIKVELEKSWEASL